jgi:phosphatidylserine decarboxylase
VKGMTYSLEEFLYGAAGGLIDEESKKMSQRIKNNLYQITVYLAPGDYHCFHSPTDWKVQLRRHFPGKLLSVRPSVAEWMPKLFAQNERVVYEGTTTQNGQFLAYVAIGIYYFG